MTGRDLIAAIESVAAQLTVEQRHAVARHAVWLLHQRGELADELRRRRERIDRERAWEASQLHDPIARGRVERSG